MSDEPVRMNSTILVGIINAILIVVGFAGSYIITTTRLEDAVATAAHQSSQLRLEIDQIRAREQTMVDSMVSDRSTTAVHLATIERDIKYIQQTLDDLRRERFRDSSQPQPPH